MIHKNNRNIRLQVMVTPALADRVSAKAERLGISVSAMGELLLSKGLASPRSRTFINTEAI
jgi:hypothetical protein